MLFFGVKTSHGILLCLELKPKGIAHKALDQKRFLDSLQSSINSTPHLLCLSSTSLQLITHYKPFLTSGSLHLFSLLFSHCSSYSRLHLIFPVTVQRSFMCTPHCSIYCSLYDLILPYLSLQNPPKFATLVSY